MRRRRSERGCVVILLDAAQGTPLYSWRLRFQRVTCLRLLLGGGSSGGHEGVLCLTDRQQLLLLAVPPNGEEGSLSARKTEVSPVAVGASRPFHRTQACVLQASWRGLVTV